MKSTAFTGPITTVHPIIMVDLTTMSTSLALASSHDTVSSHPTYDEEFFDDKDYHGSRRHQGEPYHHQESYQDAEAYDRGGSHHDDADNQGNRYRPQSHHHRRSSNQGETYFHSPRVSYDRTTTHHSSHSGRNSEHRHREHHRSAHRQNYLHSDYRYGERQRVSSRALSPRRSRSRVRGTSAHAREALQPSVEHIQRVVTRSISAVPVHVAASSNKVQPEESSTKISESLTEDEKLQKRKASRSPRAHKKVHSVNPFSSLWEKLSNLMDGFRTMLRNLTESLVFEVFIFLIVCLNTIMLVTQTFAEVEIRGEWYFVAFDSIFLSIYMVEAVLKIIAIGFSYFSDSWNDLDFFIMVMAVLDFVLMQLSSRSSKRSIYNQSVFRIFKVFKSLRALRAVRVLRRLSILTSLQKVTGTLVRSMPSITAILVLMFTCLFLFSVVLRALFRQSDPKRFQNLFTTIFTLFTLLTLDDWSLIYMDSRAQGAWYIIPILMIYIIIQYFIFLNLVIAVLVDNFQMALLKGLEKVKQERAAQIHETLLAASLTELRQAEPEGVMSEHSTQKTLMEKKFGTMSEKQQEHLFHFLQLAAGVEHYQQEFRSQKSVIDEIVDTAFEAGEQDFGK
ncbi:cation channel sperm-associated protein 1 [Saccopteryx leptura]|uniref:cation channel sperm-associated protein 1 n=1 Tax=Saccopteryx leptura TaxID=249018 RepID=UPI00339C943D